jgi:hypothetical protein
LEIERHKYSVLINLFLGNVHVCDEFFKLLSSLLRLIIILEDRATIGLVHGFDDTNDFGRDSSFLFIVDPLHHADLNFGLMSLLLCLLNDFVALISDLSHGINIF